MLLGWMSPACDRRFEYDVETSGAAGTLTTGGGGASGGSPAGGSVGGGSVPGGSAGAAAGEAGSGGSESKACGALAECSLGTHCADEQCVQCAEDADCVAYALPRCDLTRHRCVACVSTADCQPGFACDSLANRCLLTCSGEGTCPKTAHGCDERRSVCYQCDEDRECASSALGHLCASDGSGCVQCRKDADCPNQHCDQLSGRCVECRDGRDCTSLLCDPATFTCAAP